MPGHDRAHPGEDGHGDPNRSHGGAAPRASYDGKNNTQPYWLAVVVTDGPLVGKPIDPENDRCRLA
jgi:hypothetical protein